MKNLCLILLLLNCANVKKISNPFGIQYSSFESRSNTPKELSRKINVTT